MNLFSPLLLFVGIILLGFGEPSGGCHALSTTTTGKTPETVIPNHNREPQSSSPSSSSSSSSTPSRRVVAFPGLRASTFRHRLDEDLTVSLDRWPGGTIVRDGLLRQIVFPLVEQRVRLDLLSTAVKVSERQLPHVYASFTEACRILDIRSNDRRSHPQLYIQSDPRANAYTLAFRGERTAPIVVVTSALLNQCTDSELRAVLGHELGHVKCEHSIYLTTGGIVTAPLRNVLLLSPLLGVGDRIEAQLREWRLAAEYTCDRAALLVAQDPNVVSGALLKLFAGTGGSTITNNNNEFNVEAFRNQCLEYDALLDSANPFVRLSVQQRLRQRTHPLPIRRVAALEKWAASDDYARILSQGVEL